MIYSLKKRTEKLKALCKKTELKKVTELISVGSIKNKNLAYIQDTSRMLLQSCITGSSKKIRSDSDFTSVMNFIKKNKPENITHNGLIVTRKESSIEYALFLKSIFCFLESLVY